MKNCEPLNSKWNRPRERVIMKPGKRHMTLDSIALIYFSPTGTTAKVLETIAEGLGAPVVKRLNLTLPGAKTGSMGKAPADLTIIGVPVYTGRVPLQAVSMLQRMRVKDAPAIIVVVYGNREYEDALLELRNISMQAGFTPIAGAVFIGEHSFSTADNPIAEGRPDKEDLERARTFGRVVKEKMDGSMSPETPPMLEVPGNFPYRDRNPSRNTSPERDESVCIFCGKCVEVCPVNAIRMHETTLTTDPKTCILCCACIKNCLPGARTLRDAALLEFAQKLGAMCRQRKEPEFFL